MSLLAGWGYTPITIEHWIEIRDGRRKAPKRPIAITFDDGYRSIYENAWPVLSRNGFTATVFLIANCLGDTNSWETSEPQEPLLNHTQIAELSSTGICFGSHTLTHRALTEIPEGNAYEELALSRATLEAILGKPVTTLAYPFNKQNRRIRKFARRAGYRAAVLGRGRLNTRWTNPFALMRIPVDLQTSPEEFERLLSKPRWATGF